MPFNDRSVFSSHVDRIGYNPDTSELMVKFVKGKTAIYSDVPPDVADDVMNAVSIGQALYSNIRGRYKHRYV